MGTVHLLGVDLSGPSNLADTALGCFVVDGDALRHVATLTDLDDEEIGRYAAELSLAGPVIVGLDAPLSYASGGGDRPADKALRQRLVAAGLPSGTVMTPTMTRMAYLTLRGVVVARGLELLVPGVEVVEVHPAGVLALHGAPVDDIRALKQDVGARQRLVDWLARQLTGLPQDEVPTDHVVAAWAAALGVFRWLAGRSAWQAPAEPPLHPYAFCC